MNNLYKIILQLCVYGSSALTLLMGYILYITDNLNYKKNKCTYFIHNHTSKHYTAFFKVYLILIIPIGIWSIFIQLNFFIPDSVLNGSSITYLMTTLMLCYFGYIEIAIDKIIKENTFPGISNNLKAMHNDIKKMNVRKKLYSFSIIGTIIVNIIKFQDFGNYLNKLNDNTSNLLFDVTDIWVSSLLLFIVIDTALQTKYDK